MSQERVGEDERQFTLLFDDIKVKGGLVFRKNTGRLVGFCDIDHLFSPPSQGSASDQIASYMLAFMIRPIFHPSLALWQLLSDNSVDMIQDFSGGTQRY